MRFVSFLAVLLVTGCASVAPVKTTMAPPFAATVGQNPNGKSMALMEIYEAKCQADFSKLMPRAKIEDKAPDMPPYPSMIHATWQEFDMKGKKFVEYGGCAVMYQGAIMLFWEDATYTPVPPEALGDPVTVRKDLEDFFKKAKGTSV